MVISLIKKILRNAFLQLTLKRHGVIYGPKVRGGGVIIKNKGKIILKDGIFLNGFPNYHPFYTGLQTHTENAIIEIGKACILNGCMVQAREKIKIGEYCTFGPGSMVLDNDSHNTSIDPVIRRSGKIKSGEIIVGNNVWVGLRAIILKGVSIGDNSIVAAGAIITNDIPPNCIAAGNPAKVIKHLSK